MRWHRSFSVVGALALSSGGAFAATATPEGARAILRDYAAYFSQGVVDKGIVSVEPRDDGYFVTWNLRKALAAVDAPEDAFRIEDFTYVLTPGAGDSWTVKAEHFPRVAFELPTDKGQAKGVFAFDGFHFDGVYDPQADEFLRSTGGAGNLTGAFHIVDGEQASDFKFSEDGITLETRAKPAAGGAGVDVALAQAFKSLTETIVPPRQGGSEAPAEMTYTIGGVASGATLAGLRAREIGDFWRYVVAHFGEPAAPPDLKPLLQAMLPLWDEIRADAKLGDLEFQTPFGTARMKSIDESVDLSGFTAAGIAEIGVKVEDLSLASALLPGWVSSLSPASLDLSLRLTGQDWDKAARIALDDPHFGETGDLAPETGDEITQTLLGGHPKIVLAPGRLKIPALDLSFSGMADVEAGVPTAHFDVSADSLDKTIALLQDLVNVEPDAQGALLGVTMLKGLATVGADGRLVWEIESNGDGVVVNGSPLATGP